MKKKITVLATAIGIAASTPASAIVVGGIDFGAMGAEPTRTHLETATLAQTYVNGDGQNATAYGYITTINGDTSYCADGSSNCGLYYVAEFSNTQNFSSTYVEFTATEVSIFFHDGGPLNLLTQSSPDNITMIQGGTLWATLDGHNNLGGVADPSAVLNGAGALTGESLSGAGFGLFDVRNSGGDAGVISFLDANGVTDDAGGLADIALTSSFNNLVLNPFDVEGNLTIGCLEGTANPGAWCYQGTANLRGSTEVQIPEPSILALVGVGLLGFGAATRRRKA